MTNESWSADDGSSVLRAFERLARAATAPDAPASAVLEAAAMGIALTVLELSGRAPERERIASSTRKTLLGAATLRNAAHGDEDALDALELAIEQARRGLALLAGGPLSALDGAPMHEPTPHELGKLLRGELDGHAAADVALRLHRSGMRERYAAFLPSRKVATRQRLAADSAPAVRDPSLGRGLGAITLGEVSLEAFAFAGGVLAIYAEPPIGIALSSIDVPIAARALEAAGYLELTLEGTPKQATLVLTDGERSVTWTLTL